MITIIIPCLNEKGNINIILKNLSFFKKNKHLVIDGGSNDNSEKLYIKNKIKFLTTLPSRGLQQLKGAEKSDTKWLFFLHADTELNIENILEIKKFIKNNNEIKIAFFKIIFREKKFIAKFISIWANIRTLLFKLPFGDQGLLISRNYYFKIGGHSKEKVMEDLELVTKVPKKNRILLKSRVITSFRRYEKNGVFVQGIIHIICQILFLLNVNKKIIYKIYTRNE
ncbi:MAG: hypothetical protein CFH34_00484 [Alphaproteobacteria bacterium MarineAlpha9_Bin4]|nr:hypothetical protein [Pelagibacterales bacterium]PPR27075.1 MAG: hypothetical protein CFH34_00484 [Alphaproteobacteria bacterium MarineAlpha9_Bin4]|tara:strand:+ start:3623 stop:4297 length:675 start_codon:yes stop_codon:yes gene_type:complete